MFKPVVWAASFLFATVLVLQSRDSQDFHFSVLGDRTGEAQPGVYEEALREVAAAHPDFVITVGDAIQGGNDAQADSEWRSFLAASNGRLHRIPVFFTPGNHDVWSESSARAFERYAGRPLHYSFDYGQAHFTVLNNSETEQFTPDELVYLAKDLSEHSGQPLKFVFSHRPSWILQALLGDRKSIYQQLAEKYHIRYFIAGHIHQMLYFRTAGVTYLSVPSAGGHLRGDKRYESGWFFAETQVEVHGPEATFTIHELSSPFGNGRVSHPENWGAAGLVSPAEASRK